MNVHGLATSYKNARASSSSRFVSIARTHNMDALRNLRKIESLDKSTTYVSGTVEIDSSGCFKFTFDPSREFLELCEILLINDAVLVDLPSYCARAIKVGTCRTTNEAESEFADLQRNLGDLVDLVPFRLTKNEKSALRSGFKSCRKALSTQFRLDAGDDELFHIEIKDFFESTDFWDADFASSDRGSIKRALYYLLLAKCSGVPVVFGVEHYLQICSVFEQYVVELDEFRVGVQEFRSAAERGDDNGSWIVSVLLRQLAETCVRDWAGASLPSNGTRRLFSIPWRPGLVEAKRTPEMVSLRRSLAMITDVADSAAVEDFRRVVFEHTNRGGMSWDTLTGVGLKISGGGFEISSIVDPLLRLIERGQRARKVRNVAIAYKSLSEAAVSEVYVSSPRQRGK